MERVGLVKVENRVLFATKVERLLTYASHFGSVLSRASSDPEQRRIEIFNENYQLRQIRGV